MWDLPRPGLEPVTPALAGILNHCATRETPVYEILIRCCVLWLLHCWASAFCFSPLKSVMLCSAKQLSYLHICLPSLRPGPTSRLALSGVSTACLQWVTESTPALVLEHLPTLCGLRGLFSVQSPGHFLPSLRASHSHARGPELKACLELSFCVALSFPALGPASPSYLAPPGVWSSFSPLSKAVRFPGLGGLGIASRQELGGDCRAHLVCFPSLEASQLCPACCPVWK